MIGQKIILLDEVDSTNNYAAKLLAEGKMTHGTVILAEKQVAGRGQRGNVWHSEAGKQFTASLYVETAFLSVHHYLNLNLSVALAVRSTIARFIPETVQIKWPNDILVNNKKIAGILIETQWQSAAMTGAIIGVGINLIPERELPSSCAWSDFVIDVPPILEIARELAAQLEEQFQRLKAQNWIEINKEYHLHLWKMNEVIEVTTAGDELLTGKIEGIDENGNLRFRTKDSLKTFGLQEIKFTY